MKDFTLSILFLTQTVTKPEAQSKTVDNQSKMVKLTTVCGEFAESLLRVLMHCGHFPDSLVKVLLPVIDRYDWFHDKMRITVQITVCSEFTDCMGSRYLLSFPPFIVENTSASD